MSRSITTRRRHAGHPKRPKPTKAQSRKVWRGCRAKTRARRG